ncbi:MAG: U32 family peptidase [Verrucomicrobiota bacterium]
MEPELLAPAGTWDCARAAVANGADAIYFGMPRFNARMRAENFQEEDLPELMTFLHEHGVRGVVAFNTLIFPGELEAAVEQLVCLSDAGVDAVIVQDVGLARLVREVTPGVELHASTQMTITSPEGLALLDEAFVLDRAVLARENSLREIRLFHGNEPGSVPLETFVHGALCVAYSGQCLTSESLGQRSANRGECAQACRMTYDLIVDGELKELDDERYLLSPQDLAGYAEIPELLRLGVRTFKIEGRLKTPEYVAGVTRVYRQALDAALAKEEWSIRQEERYELEMAFSRGLSTGWLHGIDNQELVHGRYAKKRGADLGEVTAVGPTWIRFRGSGQVRKGDGIVFDAGLDTEREEGGRIFDVEGDRLYFGREGGPNLDRVEAGHRLWKTDDPQLNRSWKKSWKGVKGTRKRYPVRWMLAGSEGKALRLRDEETKVEVTSAISLQVAQTKPLTAEVIEAKLGKLGSSTYVLERLTIEVEDGLILPVSELNRLRRKMVEQLDQVRERGPRQTQKVVWRELLPAREISPAEIDGPVELSVLCRTEEQVEAVLQEGVGRCYVDLEDVRRYAGLVQRMRQEYGAEGKLFLATPRIQKAGETGLFRLIERAEPDGVLLRNLGGVA